MNASVSQVMYVGLATVRAGALASPLLAGRFAGMPAVAIDESSLGQIVGDSVRADGITGITRCG